MAITESGVQPTLPLTTGGMGGLGGLGDAGGIWGILILFVIAMMFGFGNGGWGGNKSNSGLSDAAMIMALNSSTRGGAIEGYTQSNDFSNLERENDIIRSDVCNGFATSNQLLATGLQGIQTSFAQAELSRSNTQAALMGQMYNQNMTALQTACDASRQVSEGFAGVNYNMAAQSCDTRNTIQSTTRDIVEAVAAEGRATREMLTNSEMERLRERNAEQAQTINALQLAASQAAQTSGIKDYVGNQFQMYNPRPVPAFSVPAPFQYSGCNCGYNN